MVIHGNRKDGSRLPFAALEDFTRIHSTATVITPWNKLAVPILRTVLCYRYFFFFFFFCDSPRILGGKEDLSVMTITNCQHLPRLGAGEGWIRRPPFVPSSWQQYSLRQGWVWPNPMFLGFSDCTRTCIFNLPTQQTVESLLFSRRWRAEYCCELEGTYGRRLIHPCPAPKRGRCCQLVIVITGRSSLSPRILWKLQGKMGHISTNPPKIQNESDVICTMP